MSDAPSVQTAPPAPPGTAHSAAASRLLDDLGRLLLVEPPERWARTLGEVLGRLVGFLGGNRATLTRFGPEGGTVEVDYWVDRGLSDVAEPVAHVGAGLAAYADALAAGGPIGASDTAAPDAGIEPIAGWVAESGAAWVQAFPVGVGGRVVAGLVVGGRGQPPDPADTRAAATAVDLLAGRLVWGWSRTEAAEQARLERIIARAVRRLNRESRADVEPVLGEVVGMLLRALGATEGSVLLRGRGATVTTAVRWREDRTGPEVETDLGIDLAGLPWWSRHAAGGRAMWVHDREDLPAEAAAEARMLRAADLRAVAVVPVAVEGVDVGFLVIADAAPRRWGRTVRAGLEVVAEAIGSTLSRAQAHVELEERAVELADRNRSLEASNRRLAEFADTVAHDLKTPLAAGHTLLQLLRRRAGEDEELQDIARRAEQHARRLTELVDQYLATARGEHQTERVDADRIVARILDEIRPLLDATEGSIDVDPLPWLSVPEGTLAPVFRNLLTNSLKYRSHDRPLRVHVRSTRQGDQIRFDVTDNGMGIPADQHEAVFGRRARVSGRAQPGDGLGLAMCRQLVEQHGGRIWVASSDEAGTTVSFTLPA